MPEQVQLAVKLALAILLGGLVGIEREIRHKPAGLRTNILINLGSTVVMIVSIEIVGRFGSGDPTRIAAQIVTGIGFLGAGTILRSGASIQGLTTAATIWVNAGIGMAIGAGLYVEAVAATAASILVLTLLPHLETVLKAQAESRLLRIMTESGPDALERMRGAFRNARVDEKELEYRLAGRRMELTVAVHAPAETLDRLTRDLHAVEGVTEVRSEPGPEG